MPGKLFEKALKGALSDLKMEASLSDPDKGKGGKEIDTNGLVKKLEECFVEAAWTLRRLPDREAGYLYTRQVFWPETSHQSKAEKIDRLSFLEARKRISLSPAQIDRMQPVLDLLACLPDPDDRRILFWAAWHQEGQIQDKIPWAKVRRSLKTELTRWTLKRRYQNALDWIAANIIVQLKAV